MLSFSHADLSTQPKKLIVGLNSNELDSSVSQNPNSTQHREFWRPIQSQRPADPAPSTSPTTSHPVPRSWMVCHRRPTSSAVPASDPCICLCACRHPGPPFFASPSTICRLRKHSLLRYVISQVLLSLRCYLLFNRFVTLKFMIVHTPVLRFVPESRE